MQYRELTATSATITTKGFGRKLYLDTGNVNENQEAASFGLVDGVNTNPSLVSKEGLDCKDLLLEICGIVDGPISAEVVSVEAAAMVKEGKELAKNHKNIVGKCPLTPEGLKANKPLSSEGTVSTSRGVSLRRKPCWPPKRGHGTSRHSLVVWTMAAEMPLSLFDKS